jgi:histidinol-phosphate aminotransferase
MTTLALLQPRGRAPKWYRGIDLYDPDRPPTSIDLSDNTNLWGPAPEVTSLVHRSASDLLSRYPAPYTRALKESLAEYSGVEPGWIVSGCGSDDILDCIFRTYTCPGDRIAYTDPGFAFVPTLASVQGLRVTAAPLADDFEPDLEKLLEDEPKLVYLAVPNNPTGSAASFETLTALCTRTTGLVVLDQAYAEFSDSAEAILSLIRDFPDRLIITRTLSKAFGLAGLRVGYAIAHPVLAADIEKTRGPYKVGTLSDAVAISALTEGRYWVGVTVEEVRVNRARLRLELRSLGLEPLSSQANFLLVPVADASSLVARMRSEGVSVRAFSNLRGIGDAIRITVGPWPMMERCLSSISRALSCV